MDSREFGENVMIVFFKIKQKKTIQKKTEQQNFKKFSHNTTSNKNTIENERNSWQ